MARDLYADGYELAERLQERGEREWSDRISNSIDDGFTATEILMALRFQITELLGSDVSLDEDTRALAGSLIADIGSALER